MNDKTELMVIPFQCSKDEYSLLIVLQDHNIKRITAYDPADVPIDKMPGSVIDGLTLLTLQNKDPVFSGGQSRPGSGMIEDSTPVTDAL